MANYLFSSTDQLIDTVYPVVVVDLLDPTTATAVSPQPAETDAAVLETNTPNLYRLRFHDRLSSGRGEPDDAAILLERVTTHQTSSSESIQVLFTWPIEFIRRYGCETKNIFILELGRRCSGFPNRVVRFDTRPAKASSLEGDFALLVKKVLKFMDPSAKALSKKPGVGGGVAALFSKNKSPIVQNAASCEYAELAPYQRKTTDERKTNPPTPAPTADPSVHYARVVVKNE